MNRVGWCFVAGIVIAVVISLLSPKREAAMRVDIKNVDFKTGTGFNVAALLIVAILGGALLHLVVVADSLNRHLLGYAERVLEQDADEDRHTRRSDC